MGAAKQKKTGHVVTGPLVCVKDEGGHVQYLYQGAPVPEYVSAEALQDLVDSGLVGTDADLAAQPETADQPAQ